ncbi:preprotein translocase subunit SecY [Buchnera aphidicola (Taiwanaphis decaspermi)]|uniref:preprotein translocase subunit SecY n=1 Tax=Buchnera aphidicola TaxID=9 RepID=UPI0031B7F770
MIKKLGLNFYNKKFYELKKRIFFVFFALVIFRIASFIPIPGINTDIFSNVLNKHQNTMIDMLNIFSGGSLNRASILALGITPYISASIIIQLLTFINSYFIGLKKEGELGRIKIKRYTKYATLFLSIIQAIGFSIGLPNLHGMNGLIINSDFHFYFVSVISLITGTLFLMWMGDLITSKGIGNGTSFIIFIGIISGFPSAILKTIYKFQTSKMNIYIFIIMFFFVFIVTFLVVFIERSYRKIIIYYSRRQNMIYKNISQTSHIPLKINMSGVMPAIFASSLLLFPSTISSWFNIKFQNNFFVFVLNYFKPGQPLYVFLYTLSIIFFCFFYSNLVFDPRETANNLKKSGAFLLGIRPGEKTANYISNIMSKINIIGSIYIAVICLLPDFMRNIMDVPFYFGGTSLLIVVVVIIDFLSQIQTLMISTKYNSLIKKSSLNLKKF